MYLDKMKTNKWKAITISLVTILVVAGLIFGMYWGYEKVTFSHYKNGFMDGMQNTIFAIAQNIEQQGYVQISLGNQSIVLAPVQPKVQ